MVSAPTTQEIASLHEGPVLEPIRVYAGRRSAETAEARADLALRELIRVGGFDRKILIVAVPSGTGWMDPGASDTVEIMRGGDVATVAVQYSYLTSILAILIHPDFGIDQGDALFRAVYSYWATLPRDARPELYVHGLGQGAYNMRYAVPILDILGDPIQGAMFTGSPFLSPIWPFVRTQRVPGSPVWRPRFGNDSLVRVQNQEGALPDPAALWGPIRMVFLSYAGDPIVQFDFASSIRRPE